MRYICNYVYLKRIKNNEKHVSIMSTGARGLTSHMSSLANEVKVGQQEPLGYATKTFDFHIESHQNHITISSQICKMLPSCLVQDAAISITGRLLGEPLVTGGFPSQRPGNMDNLSSYLFT